MTGSVIRLIPGVGGEVLESFQGWGLAVLHCLGSNSISDQKEQIKTKPSGHKYGQSKVQRLLQGVALQGDY